MKKDILDLMQDISDDIILEFSEVKPKKRKLIYLNKYIAACITLIFVIGISVNISVQAKEYEKAVLFFEENDLPTENLSKLEIKTIYKDIITEKFTYEKTAEVLVSSVKGYEVSQESITTDDLENLWKNIENKNFYFQTEKFNESYYLSEDYDFVKYEDETEIWRITFDKYWIEDYINIGENILAFGHKDRNSNMETKYSIIAMIDKNGEIIWQNILEDLSVSVATCNDDEIAVFSRRNLEYFCFNKYDLNGNLIVENETYIGVKGIWNAVPFGDEYLVEIVEKGIEEIYKVSSTGEMLESFSYSTEEYHYNIQNMIEYNDNVFFSAYTVPIKNAGYSHNEIKDICEFAFDEQILEKSEELTEKVQENYKAVLLIFNENLEKPEVFYEIEGSLGAEFNLDNQNNLVWRVETIMDTFFSPATSSFSIGGSSLVYEYKFNPNGDLINYEKTDEIVDFRK